MTGPCLCGDPYCPSCGNPAKAEFEEAVEDLADRLRESDLTDYEVKVFEAVGMAAVGALRGAEPGSLALFGPVIAERTKP